MSVEHVNDAWDYACPVCEFVSTGWKTKAAANDRGEQHEAEHETGVLMQDKLDFIAERAS